MVIGKVVFPKQLHTERLAIILRMPIPGTAGQSGMLITVAIVVVIRLASLCTTIIFYVSCELLVLRYIKFS